MSAIPTITVYKDGEHALINLSDKDRWIKAGWATGETEAVTPDPKPKARKPRTSKKV